MRKAVSETRLNPHQHEVFDRVKANMADSSFSSHRVKLRDIAQATAEDMGMRAGVTFDNVLETAYGEYTVGRVLALDRMRHMKLTDVELRCGGVERLDITRAFEGGANYATVYQWSDKAAALRTVCAWRNKMVRPVGAQLRGAIKKRIEDHEWGDGSPLRMVMSGEGQFPSAATKYAKGLLNPPTEERAKHPRQAKRRVANDGPAWLIPAGLVLAGDGALQTVTWETYIWRTGDCHRSSREFHEAILPLAFEGGLVFQRGSISLHQKVGGTFTDEQRMRGGKQSMIPYVEVVCGCDLLLLLLLLHPLQPFQSAPPPSFLVCPAPLLPTSSPLPLSDATKACN